MTSKIFFILFAAFFYLKATDGKDEMHRRFATQNHNYLKQRMNYFQTEQEEQEMRKRRKYRLGAQPQKVLNRTKRSAVTDQFARASKSLKFASAPGKSLIKVHRTNVQQIRNPYSFKGSIKNKIK